MPRKSKNNFEIVNNEVHITRDGWNVVAFASYRDDYLFEMKSYTWTIDDSGYLKNGTLGYLHRYIMEKFYGKDIVEEMYQKGYVIDHLNNNHSDCRISNLEFYKKSYNTAKGQSFDIDSKDMQSHIAVNIFKDFSTECYQITIGCNDIIVGLNEDGSCYKINSIKLLYNCDYSIVVYDADIILKMYETESIISYEKTHACDIKIEKAIDIDLTEEEKKQAFVFRNNELYLVLGNGLSYINSINYDEGWKPPKKLNNVTRDGEE